MLETTDDSIRITASGDTVVAADEAPSISKSARKRLLKQQRLQARKTERKAAEKERRRQDLERRRREWEENLADKTEEEKTRIVESRKETRRDRMEKRTEERSKRAERLRMAAAVGQKVVLDLEYSDLMSPSEIQSLAHQIMYCYAVNGKCEYPVHLWLTGCNGEIGNQLQRLPGYDKWIIEKENRPYIEAFQDNKEKLIYLTADAETILEDLDTEKIYIIGGLVDRNRWKGITLKKANKQGIQSARLPIGNYVKLASSQVLTVNQVVEILLKFVETRDWKSAFFNVIPLRKRGAVETEGDNTINVTKIEIECKEGLETVADVEVEEEYSDNDTTMSKKQRSESKTEEADIIKSSNLIA